LIPEIPNILLFIGFALFIICLYLVFIVPREK
jgi:hypothetical protein